MSVHIVVVAYALAADLAALYETCKAPHVHWHIYLHSAIPSVVAVCEGLALERNVQVVNVGFNLGLARGWNAGVQAAQLANAEAILIANDDALASPGDVDKLVKGQYDAPEAFFITGMGYDMRDKVRADMAFALGVVTPVARARLGCFDENFWPVYFEDMDWYCRAERAGLRRHCVQDTEILHAGSKTLYTATDMDTHHRRFAANQAYYVRKWGGPPGDEVYARPFNQDQFGMRIDPYWSSQPYPGFNRPAEETRP